MQSELSVTSVSQGNKLIFATSVGFGDAMEKVAKDGPER